MRGKRKKQLDAWIEKILRDPARRTRAGEGMKEILREDPAGLHPLVVSGHRFDVPVHGHPADEPWKSTPDANARSGEPTARD